MTAQDWYNATKGQELTMRSATKINVVSIAGQILLLGMSCVIYCPNEDVLLNDKFITYNRDLEI